jgi:hypothetical protein
VIEFSAELIRSLQSAAAPPAFATARHKSTQAPAVIYQFTLNDAADDLEVVMMAERARNTPDRCTVTVDVNIPSRGGWPNLAGTRVLLRRQGLLVAEQLTDAYGKAIFSGIMIDDLSLLVCEIERSSWPL